MKFINKIRSLSKRVKVATALVVLGAVVAVPMVKAEYYPARPAYDYNKPCNPNDNDPYDRCGSLNGPVFNSFIHTPSYGDERSFFDGRRSDMPTNTNADDITNVNEGSKEVTLRVYVHNNANQSTNASGKGIAHNAKVRVALPTASEQVLRARAYISANNAALVEDTADMLGSEKFSVSYIPGSAHLLRNNKQYALSDSIVTSGAKIGDKAMNGELPGCFDYAALVELKIKVNVEEHPKLQLVKQVKIKGATDGWKKEVTTKPGTEVQWRLGTKNISNSTLTHVNLRDVLPPHLNLVPGSVRIIDANQDTVQSNDPLFGGGFGMGTYPAGGIRYIIFNTTTKDDFSTCEVRVRNQAFAKSDQTPAEEKDTSDVVIKKENCNTVTPAYACDLLKAQVINEKKREVKFTVSASASNGASIERYRFTFGDGSDLTTDKNMVTHSYAKDGQYAAKVAVEVRVNGVIQIAESDKCQAVLTFDHQCVNNPKTPEDECHPCVDNPKTSSNECSPSTPPSELPNTGPGEVVLAFIGVTLASSLTYFAIVRKLAGLA